VGLEQLNFEGENKIETAMAILEAWQPTNDRYQLCFSGGKDSVCIESLAKRAGVKFTLVYNRTGIDPPELVQFINDYYPQRKLETPKMSVWEGVQHHGLPTRTVRWCCELLKEYSGKDKMLITGMRAAESVRRAKRCIVEPNRKGGKSYINPIFTWKNDEVWAYIRQNNIPYCKLYDEGFERLGCIMCPMTTHSHTLTEWQRWPKFAEAWFRAGARYWERMYPTWQAKGSHFAEMFPTPDDYCWWWVTRGQVSIPEIKYKAERMGLKLRLDA